MRISDWSSDVCSSDLHLYDTYCAQCHGVKRNGKGVNVVGLTVKPRDHSDTVAMSSLPRDQMIKAISEGGAAVNKSALMPTWSGVLTHEQLEDMAEYSIYVCMCAQARKSTRLNSTH